MQEQARNHNTLQRLEHELSGGGRSREKLEEKLAQLEQALVEQKRYGLELTEQRHGLQEEQKQHNQAIAALEQEVEQRKRQQF